MIPAVLVCLQTEICCKLIHIKDIPLLAGYGELKITIGAGLRREWRSHG